MNFILLILSLIVFVVYCDDTLRFSMEENEKVGYGNECPNHKTKCKNFETCCPTKHGSYHCCRYRNAVCCPDKYHCCPSGSECDTRNKRCRRGKHHPLKSLLDPPEWKLDAKVAPKPMNAVVCPNKKTVCSSSQTCCLTYKGNYHCCNHISGVCCADRRHCCPQGTTCDADLKRCIHNEQSMTKLLPSIVKPQMMAPLDTEDTISVPNIGSMCPNNKTKCKDTKTCCVTKKGNYYCCPHKNAVCCPDKYHCCPQGNKCDAKTNKCISMESMESIVKHRFSLISTSENTPIETGKYCPNSKLSCSGAKRCCEMDGGKFGCCTFNKGVCCPDMKSCCPHGTTCDVKNKTCKANPTPLLPINKSDDVKLMNIKKAEVINERKSMVVFVDKVGLGTVCPDKESCASGQTCCAIGGGRYGCCPYQQGTCCPDLKTCCPHNTKCISGGCTKKLFY